MMVNDMIETVRAALEPGADPETRTKAASILRGLLKVIEPDGSRASPPPVPSEPAPTADARLPAAPDLLTAIVEKVRPLLPPETLADMPRFRVPLIDFSPKPSSK